MVSRPTEAFVDSIGVNTHLHYLDTNYAGFDEVVLPRLMELGVRHIRDGVVALEKIRALGREGVRLMPLADAGQWEALAGLSPLLTGLEGPNETDIFNFNYKGQAFPEGTRQFMKDFFAFAKASPALRTLPVLAPSSGRPGGGNVLGETPCDAGNIHSYAGGRAPETPDISERFTRPARKVAGNGKVLYATECGYHTLPVNSEDWAQPGVSEQAAAKYITRLLLHNFREGIRRSYLYELLDTVSTSNKSLDGTGSESHYGLVRPDGTPKPSFTALRNLIRLLEEPGADVFSSAELDFEISGTEELESLLLHKQDGSFYLVLWQPVTSFDLATKKDLISPEREVTISLPAPARELTLWRPLEGVEPLTFLKETKEIKVAVPDHPVVVRILPETPLSVLPDLVLEEFEFIPPTEPGGAVGFRAVVANKGTEEVPAGLAVGVTAYEEGEKSGPATSRRMGTYGTHSSGLAPGASVEIRASGPRWVPQPGRGQAIILVDDVDRVEELDESNNSKKIPLP